MLRVSIKSEVRAQLEARGEVDISLSTGEEGAFLPLATYRSAGSQRTRIPCLCELNDHHAVLVKTAEQSKFPLWVGINAVN